jgi:hypothetical protein
MEVPPPARDPNWRLTLIDVVTIVVSMATTMLYEDENGLLTHIECRTNMSQPISNILSSTLERIRAGYQTGHCSIYLQIYDQSMNWRQKKGRLPREMFNLKWSPLEYVAPYRQAWAAPCAGWTPWMLTGISNRTNDPSICMY